DGCEFREALQAVAVEGGVAGNVVPDRAVVTINHRFAPDRTVDEARAAVESVLAPHLEPGDEVEVVDAADAAPPSLSHPLLAALRTRNDLPVRAKLGWTDVSRFAAAGIPAANFGPGDSTLAHRSDERVERASLEAVHRALEDRLRRGACGRGPDRRAGRRGGPAAPARRPRGWRGAGSEPAQHRHDPAVDPDLVGVELHRLEAGVRRLEHDLAVAPVEGLDRRLVARDAGHHDVPRVGGRLRPADDVVAVEDAGLDHRVAPDPEHEQLALAGEVDGEGEQLLDVLLRQDVGAGGDVAHEGHVAHGPALGRRVGVRVPPDLEGPGRGGVAPEVAPALQGGEVGVHGGGGGEADGLADLAHRRRVAVLARVPLDDLEDLSLAVRQWLRG